MAIMPHREIWLQGVLIAAVAACAVACTWDSGQGASFNLGQYANQPSFSVFDAHSGDDNRNYSYVFSVCKNVPHPPAACSHKSAAAAYQVANFDIATSSKCHPLSDALPSKSFSLYDVANPAAGVVLTYSGGEVCPSGARRAFRIALLCHHDVTNIPDEELVAEPHTCQYEVFINTAVGCPTECPVANGRLCGGHGVCAYDTMLSRSRCFCNTGFTGATCTSRESGPGANPVTVVLVIVCLLLVVLVAGVGYAFLRLRRLRVNPDAYSRMEHQFNEVGQLSSARM